MLGRHRAELEDRVDRHQLDSGALVELAARHAGKDAVHGLRGARPDSAPGSEETAVRVEQPEVDRPGVDGNRVDATRFARGARSPSSTSR